MVLKPLSAEVPPAFSHPLSACQEGTSMKSFVFPVYQRTMMHVMPIVDQLHPQTSMEPEKGSFKEDRSL